MNIRKIHDQNKPHTISVDDAMKYGIKKAAILGMIDRFPQDKKETWHNFCPYIDKETFYIYLQELLDQGILIEENDS